jgi:hypothetical protein
MQNPVSYPPHFWDPVRSFPGCFCSIIDVYCLNHKKSGVNCMAHIVKRFSLTPTEAAEKALIVDQIRSSPRGPWVNGKKMNLPTPKGTISGSKKKD